MQQHTIVAILDSRITKEVVKSKMATTVNCLQRLHQCNFFQRQTYLRPMTTPELEKTTKGFLKWIFWKFILLVYLLSIASPLTLYVACLLVIGIKRESSPTLSIVMAILLHPASTLLLGYSVKLIGSYLMSRMINNQSNSLVTKILSRFFTYSLNFHLTLIAAITFYLYELWVSFQNQTSINFENKSYNQCTCDILSEFGHNDECINEETGNSFQNKFIYVPMEELLVAFLSTSFLCHLVQSFMLWIPPPLELFYFVRGCDKDTNEKIETKKMSPDLITISQDNVSTNQTSCIRKIMKGLKISWCVLAVVYISLIMTVPLTSYKLYAAKGMSFHD